MLAPRVERIQKSLDGHGITATMYGPISLNFLDPPEQLGRHARARLAYIGCTVYGADLTNEATEIASVSPHWLVHDSFGRPNAKLQAYTKSESLAYSIGDLHLAVGDGDLLWSNVLTSTPAMTGSTFNIELNPDLWPDMPHCVATARQLISDAVRIKAV